MTPELSSFPRIELRDSNGTLLLVCFTKHVEQYNNHIVPRAKELNATITILPPKKRTTARTSTLRQRQALQTFLFRKP